MACTQSSREYRKSFPSGHSSHSACFATLLTLHLLRHASLAVADRHAKRVRLLQLLALVPPIIALFIAASRVHDNRHHPADVVAGLGLGTGCAALAHHIVWGHAPPTREKGGSEQPEGDSDPLV